MSIRADRRHERAHRCSEDDPAWADWSVLQLRAQAQVHQLSINPVIYAELSLAFESVDALDSVISRMGLVLQAVMKARAGCTTLWSEDFQHGMKLQGRLTIRNPFRPD